MSEQIVRDSAQLNDLRQDSTRLENQYSDTGTKLNNARGDKGVAEGEKNRLKNEVHSREEAIRQVREQLNSFQHNIEDSLRQLEPRFGEAFRQFDMANFYQRRFEIDFFGVLTKGILELIMQNKNWGGAAIVSFWAACMRTMAAQLGTRSQLNMTLEAPMYFRVADVVRNQAIEQYEQAKTALRNAEEQRDNQLARSRDTFYENMLAEKQGLYGQSQQEAAIARSAHEVAQNAVHSLETMFKQQRADMNAARVRASDKQQDIQEKQQSVQSWQSRKRAEDQRKADERYAEQQRQQRQQQQQRARQPQPARTG